MAKGPWQKVKPGVEAELLAEPWPIAERDDRKAVWHFSQFYALRSLALSKGNLSAAIRCQENMKAVDEGWAAANPLPRKGVNGALAHDTVSQLLPANAEPTEDGQPLLGAVLEKSRGGSEKGGEGNGDD